MKNLLLGATALCWTLCRLDAVQRRPQGHNVGDVVKGAGETWWKVMAVSNG